MYLTNPSRAKDQRRTKEEPRNDQRTPNHQKSTFVKIAVSFTSLKPSLKIPTDDREMTERTPTEQRLNSLPAKAFFLRLLPNKVVLIPKKVSTFPKRLTAFLKKLTYLFISQRGPRQRSPAA